MKYCFTIILMLSYSYVFSGECFIKAEILHFDGKFACLQKPVYGFYTNNCSYDNTDTIFIENNLLVAKIKCHRPVFATVFFSGFPVYLIMQPGDSISFKLDFSQKVSDNKYSIQFFGSNAEGQRLFYLYNYWPAEKYEVVWSLIKGDKNLIVKNIKEEINRQKNAFLQLLHAKKIDKGFYDLVASTVTVQLLSEAIRKVLNENISNIKLSKFSRWSIAKDLFSLYNTSDERIFSGLNTMFYRRLYLSFLKIKQYNTASYYNLPDTLVKVLGYKFHITGDFYPLLFEKDRRRKEVLFGSQLINYLLIEPGFELLKDEIAYFKNSFPQSEYLKPVHSLITINKERILKELINTRVFDSTAAYIVDSTGKLNNLKEIEELLGERVTYVDIWATWCMPCIKEMQFNFKVDSFLHEKKINRLYISIDAVKDSLKWREMISKMHLGGYHILAGENLQKQLVSAFGVGNNLLVIPIYFFLKNGKIVLKDAASPSDFDTFKIQAESIINN